MIIRSAWLVPFLAFAACNSHQVDEPSAPHPAIGTEIFGKKIVNVIQAKCTHVLAGDSIRVSYRERFGKDYVESPLIVLVDSIACPGGQQFRRKKCPQPFSDEAKKATSELVLNKPLEILFTSSGREFVIIDGINLSEYLIKNGLAWHYTFKPFNRNSRYSDDYQLFELEQQARAKKINIWSQEDPVAPWNWFIVQERILSKNDPDEKPKISNGDSSETTRTTRALRRELAPVKKRMDELDAIDEEAESNLSVIRERLNEPNANKEGRQKQIDYWESVLLKYPSERRTLNSKYLRLRGRLNTRMRKNLRQKKEKKFRNNTRKQKNEKEF